MLLQLSEKIQKILRSEVPVGHVARFVVEEDGVGEGSSCPGYEMRGGVGGHVAQHTFRQNQSGERGV